MGFLCFFEFLAIVSLSLLVFAKRMESVCLKADLESLKESFQIRAEKTKSPEIRGYYLIAAGRVQKILDDNFPEKVKVKRG
jgi:hypothetical protein